MVHANEAAVSGSIPQSRAVLSCPLAARVSVGADGHGDTAHITAPDQLRAATWSDTPGERLDAIRLTLQRG
jgi:hypothetical protein